MLITEEGFLISPYYSVNGHLVYDKGGENIPYPEIKWIKVLNVRKSVGRTDAEAPILWPPDVKSRVSGEAPDVGKY